WYSFDVPPSDGILDVSLKMSTPLSAVELTYAVFEKEGDGAASTAIARPQATAIGVGAELTFTDCIKPGSYFVAVEDFHGTAQDARQTYQLTVSTRADSDSHEPNDDPSQAVNLSDGISVEATIACRGDEDWFVIDVPARHLLRVRLDSEIAGYEPTVTVYDTEQNVQFREANASGSVRATEIDRHVILPEPGRYFVVVTDDDKVDADPSVPYTLTVDLVEDIDPNEPNNNVREATPLSESLVSCGGSWSTMEAWGTIAAPGDNDWFKLPLNGCENGIIEARMEFDTSSLSNEEKWALSRELQATLTLVRPHAETSCTEDSECALLEGSCAGDLDCAGLFESCHAQERQCVGGLVCLPEGVCGANQVQRRYECSNLLAECQASADRRPWKNKAVISAPLFGADVVYLWASDFASQATFPNLRYDLRVRVRQDPDSNEPSNLFTNHVQNPLPIREHQSFATEVPVYDCTGAEPECCSGNSWTTGSISYENDMDWYKYEHPCPDEDCMVRFNYRYDAGPVDMVMNIYRGRSLWFTAFDIDQEDHHPAASGALGGLSADSSCFYAYHGHSSAYYVQVRDLFELLSNNQTVHPLSKDWDPDQSYSFCVEKLSNQCEAPPCRIRENGNCDTP
ncbi:MAG: hypothetical protein ACNA8W_02440, partial [Bradymonadaceae bacterium]